MIREQSQYGLLSGLGLLDQAMGAGLLAQQSYDAQIALYNSQQAIIASQW